MLLLLSLSATVPAQETEGRINLKLDPSDKSLSISQYKVETEMLEGGGLRITYTNPTLKQTSWINITKKLDKPMIVSRVGVRIKTASGENPIAGIVLENGAMFSRRMPCQGDSLSEYEVEFSGMTDKDGNASSDTAAKAVNLTFGVVAEEGAKTIEVKDWWVE